MGTANFGYTGGWQKWKVPEKVTRVGVTLDGASSGQVLGARVLGYIDIPKSVNELWIHVGQAGLNNNGATGGAQTSGGGGAGGNGQGHNGGMSGGGATRILFNSASGKLLAVAGGAGGASGDRNFSPPPGQENYSGRGGRGGPDGEHGFPGNSQPLPPSGYGNATGGTQSQAGKGGSNVNSNAYDGKNGAGSILGRGGAGGTAGIANSWGGGGGGGGYYPGGGGQAGTGGTSRKVPGGGGGAGSSYTGGITGARIILGGAAIGDGALELVWRQEGAANEPPITPTKVTINDVEEKDELATNARDFVVLKATIDDPDQGQDVRLIVQLSDNKEFINYREFKTDWVAQGNAGTKQGQQQVSPVEVAIRLQPLADATLYYARMWTEDRAGIVSLEYNATTFWTDRDPLPPVQTEPKINSRIPEEVTVTFRWVPKDPDNEPENGVQRGFHIQYRTAGTVNVPAGAWVDVRQNESADTSWTFNDQTFKPNTAYQWRVQTRDPAGLWGPYSETWRFFVTGSTMAPALIYPINNQGVAVGDPTANIIFDWEYVDPRADTVQVKADIQWRAVGSPLWTTYYGSVDPDEPGSESEWAIPSHLFLPGIQYEWQAKTYNSVPEAGGQWTTLNTSYWSDSGFFWGTPAVGSENGSGVLPTVTTLAPPLGCGINRVYIYERGGQRLLGEITPITTLQWTRKRDDISTCNLTTNGFGWDCGQRLADLRSMQHELVVFRDGERVWEGPVTRVGYHTDHVEIEAKDVMMYLYRRIMRVGYNDSYEEINGVRVGGGLSVVTRATQIIVDAMAYDNPKVIEYLTPVETSRDAKEGRSVHAFSRTAWEEVDDLAASAGLDYVTVGRRIIMWDTHEQIGVLPEMRDGDFSDPPVVTEYGMNLANFFAVTNGEGIYGTARAEGDSLDAQRKPLYYGWVEQLSTSYSEESDPTAQELTEQAGRNIANRWPAPVVVRVPDNTTLNPELVIGINQLIPGVWIPLRSSATLRKLTQVQKLDSVTVSQDSNGEKIQVVMSPRPRPREDPDADAAAEAEEQG